MNKNSQIQDPIERLREALPDLPTQTDKETDIDSDELRRILEEARETFSEDDITRLLSN